MHNVDDRVKASKTNENKCQEGLPRTSWLKLKKFERGHLLRCKKLLTPNPPDLERKRKGSQNGKVGVDTKKKEERTRQLKERGKSRHRGVGTARFLWVSGRIIPGGGSYESLIIHLVKKRGGTSSIMRGNMYQEAAAVPVLG